MTDNHYDRTTRICKHLNIENLGEHHGVLLADALENFIYRDVCLNAMVLTRMFRYSTELCLECLTKQELNLNISILKK